MLSNPEHHREQHGPDGATFFERHPIPLEEVFAESIRGAEMKIELPEVRPGLQQYLFIGGQLTRNYSRYGGYAYTADTELIARLERGETLEIS